MKTQKAFDAALAEQRHQIDGYEVLALFAGHSQILSCNCGEKSGSGLGTRLVRYFIKVYLCDCLGVSYCTRYFVDEIPFSFSGICDKEPSYCWFSDASRFDHQT